jgi:hypothetical protein
LEEFDQTKLPCFIHGKNSKVEKNIHVKLVKNIVPIRLWMKEK